MWIQTSRPCTASFCVRANGAKNVTSALCVCVRVCVITQRACAFVETWRACGCTPNHTLSLQPAIEEPDMSTQVDDLSEWRSFFDEAADFVEGIERQYGVANERFTEYAIDRLELTVQSCSAILDRFISATTEPLGEDDRRVVLQYREEMQDTISVLRRILQQWHEYRSVLDSGASSRYLLSYRSGTTQSGRGRGRPRFDVSIQQVQYLKSLFFTWSEIAALLGVSRMTLYRYGICVIPGLHTRLVWGSDIGSQGVPIIRDPLGGACPVTGYTRGRRVHICLVL